MKFKTAMLAEASHVALSNFSLVYHNGQSAAPILLPKAFSNAIHSVSAQKGAKNGGSYRKV